MKSTKAVAKYRDRPNGSEHCSLCTMWSPPHGCTAVEGPVRASGWCEYYASVAAALKDAAKQVDRNPTEGQKEAGNYRKGSVRIAGIEIAIENPKGSVRSGVDKDGKPWRVTLPAHYGDLKKSEGADGDPVDIYIGEVLGSNKVFIVDQVDARSKRFDEHKALLGFPSKGAALSAYKKAFSDGKGAQRIGAVTETTVDKFKTWAQSGDTTKRASVQHFAAGGKVMPLKQGSSRASVSSNIKTELAAGKPRDQALAIAISTARRYGKRATGGRVGYAGGGIADDTPAEMTRDILPPRPRAAPILDTGPIPGQDWAEGDIKREMSDLGGIIAEQTGLPSIYRGAGRVVDPESSALDRWRGAGEMTMGAMPGMGLYGRGLGMLYGSLPRATATSAFLGGPDIVGSFLPRAEAAEQPKADPSAALRKSLEQLQSQREKQQSIADKAKERQDANRPKGRAPDEKRDPKFFEAKREYDDAQESLKGLNPEIKDTQQRIGDAEKTARDAAGGESLKTQEGEKSFLQSALPYAGPIVGGALGYLGGKGIQGLTKYLDKSGVETANRLLPGSGKTKPINQRIGSINDFWMKGGSEKPPFLEANKAPWWKASQKDVATPHDLYPARSRALDWTANAGLTGVYGGEAALGYKWGEDAHQEMKAAREAFNTDKSEGNVQRLLKAERNAEIADFMLRMGLAGALAQGVKGSVGIAGTPAPRPNISRAETERADIRQALAASKAKAQAKAERSGGPGSSKKQSSPPHSPNGAARLLPLGLLPLAGSVGGQEPPPSLSPALETSDLEQPYAEGGEVKHHSHYQPRDKQYRFTGGPVYPKANKSSSTSKGGEPRTTGGASEFKRGGSVNAALEVARRYARGGAVHVGPVVGKTDGRADKLPINVPAGAYVIPSDCVSAVGSGNSLAGMEKLTKSFGKPQPHRAAGGAVPIAISDGEFVLSPDQVAKVGNGSLDAGHKTLDHLVKRIRAEHIRTLQQLPGPAR